MNSVCAGLKFCVNSSGFGFNLELGWEMGWTMQPETHSVRRLGANFDFGALNVTKIGRLMVLGQ